MKKVIIAVCIICLFATCSFAGNLIFSPVIEKPASGDMDTYVIANDNGVIKLPGRYPGIAHGSRSVAKIQLQRDKQR